ncbi:MAG: Ig-like domain-containing protein [Salinivirgaceae bacterium]|nr:Ig-like domain-containing protein [Salinivirgaceae bacterium]
MNYKLYIKSVLVIFAIVFAQIKLQAQWGKIEAVQPFSSVSSLPIMDVTQDLQNNVYVFSGNGGGTVNLAKIGLNDNLIWQTNTSYTTDASNYVDVYARHVEVLSDNNVVIVGNYRLVNGGSISFGNSISISTAKDRGENIFIALYNDQGVAQWAKQIDIGSSNAGDYVHAFTTNVDNNIYVAGGCYGSGDNYEYIYGFDKFGASEGNITWDGSDPSFNYSNIPTVNDIYVDDIERVFITGSIGQGSTEFTTTNTLTASGGSDIIVASFNSLSKTNLAWVKKYGSSNSNIGDQYYEKGLKIVGDNLGSVYVIGNFSKTTSFGSITLSAPDASSVTNMVDMFVLRLRSNGGEEKWAKRAGGGARDTGVGIQVDANSNVYAYAYLNNYYDVTIDNYTPSFPVQELPVYLKYDKEGNIVWYKELPAITSDWYGKNLLDSKNGSVGIWRDGVIYNVTDSTALTLNYPAALQSNVELSPKLKWTSSLSNEKYRVRLFVADNLETALVDELIDTTFYQLGELDREKEYLWSINNEYSNVLTDTGRFTTRGLSVILDNYGFYSDANVSPNTENPSNYLHKELPIRFKISINNELTQNLATTTATLSCSTAGVTVNDNSVGFNNIISGSSGWSVDEFEIIADAAVTAGTLLEFEISIQDQIISGGPWVSTISFPIAPFENGIIVLDDDANPDSNGDNDDIPEPGETLELLPTINNISAFSFAKVEGKLTCNQDFIDIWNGVNGGSGYVYDHWKYNMLSNVQTTVDALQINILPAFDFVFDYPESAAMQELNFSLVIEGRYEDNEGPLMKWATQFVYNEGIEAPPELVETTPSNNSIDISVDSNFELVFDSEITADSGKFIHIHQASSTNVISIAVQTDQLTVSNATVTINPLNDLMGGTAYYILVDQGAFKGNSGSAFAGIDSPEIWNFTTLQNDPPAAPLNVSTEVISSSEINISWDASELADSYQILSCDENTVYASLINETNFTVSALDESTSYDFVVKAVNVAGASGVSDCVAATTQCEHPWGEPVIYPNSTTAYGIVTIEGEQADASDLVAVFVNDECRGISSVTINNNTAYVTINIQGETAEEVHFKIWDASTCAALNVGLMVQSNPGGNLGYPPNYLLINASDCEPINVDIDKQICQGSSFEFGTQVLTDAGSYTEIFTSQNGCDSTVNLDLFIVEIDTTFLTETICESESFMGASESGIYWFTETSAMGCDSVIQVDLTVNAIDTISVSHSICEGETYNGESEAGVYWISETSILTGCDSIIELELSVNDLPFIMAACNKDTIDAGEEVMVTVVYSDSSDFFTYYPTTDTLIVHGVTSLDGCYNSDAVQIIVRGGTSVGQFAANAILIYPNPVFNKLTIETNSDFQEALINISNSDGKRMYSGKLKNATIQHIDVSNYNSGVYFIQLTSAEKVVVRKIIVE